MLSCSIALFCLNPKISDYTRVHGWCKHSKWNFNILTMDFPKFPQKKTSSATMSKTRDGRWSMIKIASISFFSVWSFTCVHLLLCIFSSSFLFFASVFLWWTFCCGQKWRSAERKQKRDRDTINILSVWPGANVHVRQQSAGSCNPSEIAAQGKKRNTRLCLYEAHSQK